MHCVSALKFVCKLVKTFARSCGVWTHTIRVHALLVAVREDVDGQSILTGVDMIYRDDNTQAIQTRFVGARGLVAEGVFEIDLNQSSEMIVAEASWSGIDAIGQRVEMRRRLEISGNQMIQKTLSYTIDGRESDEKSLQAMERIFQRTS